MEGMKELPSEVEPIIPVTNLREIMERGLKAQEQKLDDTLGSLDLARAMEGHHRTFSEEFRTRVDRGVFSDIDSLSRILGVTRRTAPKTLEEAWDSDYYGTEILEVGVYLHEKFGLSSVDALAILNDPGCKERMLNLMEYLHNYRTALALESTLGEDHQGGPYEGRKADFEMLELGLVQGIERNIGEIGSFVEEQRLIRGKKDIPELNLTRGEQKILDALSKDFIHPWDLIDKMLDEQVGSRPRKD